MKDSRVVKVRMSNGRQGFVPISDWKRARRSGHSDAVPFRRKRSPKGTAQWVSYRSLQEVDDGSGR